MNSKEKSAWLNRGRHIEAELNDLMEEYRDALDEACRITARYSSNNPGGSGGNPHKFDRVAEYCEHITESMDKLYLTKAEILSAIDAVADPAQHRLLFLRYVRCYSWGKVAQKMAYSESMTYIIHRKALKALPVPEPKDCSSL